MTAMTVPEGITADELRAFVLSQVERLEQSIGEIRARPENGTRPADPTRERAALEIRVATLEAHEKVIGR